jgi:hypothetical protein
MKENFHMNKSAIMKENFQRLHYHSHHKTCYANFICLGTLGGLYLIHMCLRCADMECHLSMLMRYHWISIF